MIIGLMSDTHDHLSKLSLALATFAENKVEAIIHAGDFVAPFAARSLRNAVQQAGVPLYCVYGNNDGDHAALKSVLPDIQQGPLLLTLDERKILVHHFIDWCDSSDVEQAEIVVTGHTHQVGHSHEDGRLFVNPGECCGWVGGQATVCILDTRSLEVRTFEL